MRRSRPAALLEGRNCSIKYRYVLLLTTNIFELSLQDSFKHDMYAKKMQLTY